MKFLSRPPIDFRAGSLPGWLVWLLVASILAVSCVLWNLSKQDAGDSQVTEFVVQSSDASTIAGGVRDVQQNASSPTETASNHARLAELTQQTFDGATHPLDPLLELAQAVLVEIDSNLQDYSTTLINHVFADGKLQPQKTLFCKVRQAQKNPDGALVPLSIYTKFVEPQALAGQEVIWVDGWNDNQLVAHAAGMLNLKRVFLDPNGARAMAGNRRPVYDLGIRTLLIKMMEIGNRDRKYDECAVQLSRGLKIGDRNCTLIEVVHPQRRDHFEFHVARIFLDDQRGFPIAFEGYSWPDEILADPLSDLTKLPLLEKYYYTDLKFNIGLTDQDFRPENPDYHFPSW